MVHGEGKGKREGKIDEGGHWRPFKAGRHWAGGSGGVHVLVEGGGPGPTGTSKIDGIWPNAYVCT
jgi:hypothetical protein